MTDSKLVRMYLRGRQYDDARHKCSLVLRIPADAAEAELTRLGWSLPDVEWLDQALLERIECTDVQEVRVEDAEPDARPSAVIRRDEAGALEVAEQCGVADEDGPVSAPVEDSGEVAAALILGESALVQGLLEDHTRPPGGDVGFEVCRYGQGRTRVTITGDDPAVAYLVWLLVSGEAPEWTEREVADMRRMSGLTDARAIKEFLARIKEDDQ
jgi:hypothetical protein